MTKCQICGFEAKNSSGLRLHMKKHRNEQKEEPKLEENVGRETGIEMNEKPIEYFTAPIRIRLWNKDDVMVLEYPVFSSQALEDAKISAQKKGFRIEIKQAIIE